MNASKWEQLRVGIHSTDTGPDPLCTAHAITHAGPSPPASRDPGGSRTEALPFLSRFQHPAETGHKYLLNQDLSMDKSEKLLLNVISGIFIRELVIKCFLYSSYGTSKRLVVESPKIPMGSGQDPQNSWSSDSRPQTQSLCGVINSDCVLTLVFCT